MKRHITPGKKKRLAHTGNHREEQIYHSPKCVHVLKSPTDTYQSALSSSEAFIINRGNHRRLLIGDALVGVSEVSGVLSLSICELPQLGEKRRDVALSCAPPVDSEGCNLKPSFSSHHSLWLAALTPRLEHTNSGMAVWESPPLVTGIESKRNNMQMTGKYHLGCQSLKWNKKFCTAANNTSLGGVVGWGWMGLWGGGNQMKKSRKKGKYRQDKWKQCGNQSRPASAYVRLWLWQAFRQAVWNELRHWHDLMTGRAEVPQHSEACRRWLIRGVLLSPVTGLSHQHTFLTSCVFA